MNESAAPDKNLLITGASGFIGSFLVEEALRNGYKVFAALRSSSSKQYLQHKDIQFVDLDLSSPNSMQAQFAKLLQQTGGIDYIIHNAGITRADNKRSFEEVNYRYTRHFSSALLAAGIKPKKFVLISSMAASGPGEAVHFTPIQPGGLDKPLTAYAQSKLLADQYILGQQALHPVIIRPTAVFGPRDKDFLAYFRMLAAGWDLYIGNKKQLLSFIYVRDLARAVIATLEYAQPATSYIVSDGNAYPKEEMGNLLRGILHTRATKIYLPALPVKASIFVLEKAMAMFGKMPFLNTDKLKEITAQNWYCNSSNLWADLQMQPAYTLEQALTETANWYIENGWLSVKRK
jgi:nucleoside-diphosphate-sugar epimerase